MKHLFTIILLIMTAGSTICAQISDSAYVDRQKAFKRDKNYKRANPFNPFCSKFIVPAAFISYGLVARASKPLRRLDYSIHDEISQHMQTKIPVDDYSQYVPALAVYGLGFMGIEAKHNFRDRTLVMAASYLLMGSVVQTMKRSINVMRPDGSGYSSFPSGHTATVFVGAHILFKEYKDTSPWIGIAGYTVAAGTGALRVLNRKHWVSDVVAGAGIGILSAEAGYLMLPVFQNMLGIKKKSNRLVILPSIGVDSYGIGVAYTFVNE
ncbi:MAG: phosphatase PAP2 family protein [Tannerellaceae bacterium]|jgi:membrane-associated phospholipid phosphatase|nr:phosphatase PAP2 family protein [Tannerellaceae bacterium]